MRSMNTAPTKFTFRVKPSLEGFSNEVDHLYTAERLKTCYHITWLDMFGKSDSTTYPHDSVSIFLTEKASWMKDRRPDWIIQEIIEA